MSNCELCGEPMPEGEEMFKFHGYSGNCPKPPLQKKKAYSIVIEQAEPDSDWPWIANFSGRQSDQAGVGKTPKEAVQDLIDNYEPA